MGREGAGYASSGTVDAAHAGICICMLLLFGWLQSLIAKHSGKDFEKDSMVKCKF